VLKAHNTLLIYVTKSRHGVVSSGRPLDGGRIGNGSENDVRAGLRVGAKAPRGSLGAVYEPMRLSLRSSHGPQTRKSRNLLANTFSSDVISVAAFSNYSLRPSHNNSYICMFLSQCLLVCLLL